MPNQHLTDTRSYRLHPSTIELIQRLAKKHSNKDETVNANAVITLAVHSLRDMSEDYSPDDFNQLMADLSRKERRKRARKA